MRSWTGLVAACALLAALPAGAATSFTDASGDTTGPDISTVSASNDLNDLTIEVHFANRPTLANGDAVLVDLDLDGNKSTGEDGVDLYAVLEGGEEPVVLSWQDGVFAENGEAKATFASGTATLSLPLDLVKGTVGIVALAVGGPDPDVSPTDRAPDGGAWTYTIERPALQKATVRFKPAQPRAGKTFAVDSVSLVLTVAGAVTPDNLTCSARLGGTALQQPRACTWKLPRTAKNKTLTVSIVAEFGDTSYRLAAQRFKVK
jgi:hypothetical protein